jgi:photosystem II stability/assembly factor-like uncharacterized protein
MRVAIGWAAACWCMAAMAQVEKPPEQPTERPALQNTGKPMTVDFQCSEEDIQTFGLGCSLEDPCPIYLELSSVEAVGNHIFVEGNIHSSSTTLYSVLLTTSDAGKTWTEPHERIRTAGLDRIQFVDFENGWISGQMLHPIPHDPFFLVTADGGKQWRARPIFPEPHFAQILQFWFSSRGNGALLIDRGQGGDSGRYELYETPNGGETWALRQTNERPMQLKRISGTADADWRVRADKGTHAYRVERHFAGFWRAVASFAVSLGGCKPPELPPPAPPAAESPQP